MVFRMAEYKAIIQRKYRIPVKQFVVYLGTAVPTMRTQLKDEEIISGFELINIAEIDYQKWLVSEVPEAIMLAILADFGAEKPHKVIREVLSQLIRLSEDEIKLDKYIQQLKMLSRLRKLEEIMTQEVKNMPIRYNVKTDYLYKMGKAEGELEGVKKGMQEGMQKNQITIAQNLLSSHPFSKGLLSFEDIASACGLSLEQVKALYKQLKTNKEKEGRKE